MQALHGHAGAAARGRRSGPAAHYPRGEVLRRTAHRFVGGLPGSDPAGWRCSATCGRAAGPW